MKNMELVFILDCSGSMSGLESDTIGGFNAMLKKQAGSEALVTTVLFNHELKVVHDRLAISGVKPMTEADYCACGCTALLDAVGKTVEHIKTIHKYARAEDVPEHTLVVITTDGMENASRQYTAAQVKALIEEQKQRGWEFLFLGANIDAVQTAASFGIAEERAVNFNNDSKGIELNYKAVCSFIGSMDAGKPVGKSWKAGIEEDFAKRSGKGKK